ncbi:ankyrin repeat domain-containing protein [Endozoicomonas sp. YOMI1]|uniref:ankyrin repeat domain-containing protein n=1 Tax=Endozoicomonas sp. YOMI1 TaxID=2828739 RepID=UPI0021490F13|nr:ankyrin repeat domain-containing protein [Endozoicomonas sp. YOMI1]
MDLTPHYFNLSRLQELISEETWLVNGNPISSGVTQENISSGCGLCDKGFIGGHSVKMLHIFNYFLDDPQHAPVMHLFHDKCLREWRTVNPALNSKCPTCRLYVSSEITFSPVTHAVKAGEEEKALKLIADGADPDVLHSWKGMAAVHIATKNGNLGLLRSLLSCNADINRQDKKGMTALHHAVKSNNLQALQLLLDHKADMNIQEIDGYTALHLAAGNPKKPELFDTLIAHDASFDLADFKGRKVIHHAAESGHEPALKKLIVKHADVNVLDEHKATPLFYATNPFFKCRSFNSNAPEVVRILLAAGARIELFTSTQETAFDLISSVVFRDPLPIDIELLEELLPEAVTAITEVNLPVCSSGRSLLYFALMAKDREAVLNLIARGANVSTIKPKVLEILLRRLGEQRQAFVKILNQACSTSRRKRRKLS